VVVAGHLKVASISRKKILAQKYALTACILQLTGYYLLMFLPLFCSYIYTTGKN